MCIRWQGSGNGDSLVADCADGQRSGLMKARSSEGAVPPLPQRPAVNKLRRESTVIFEEAPETAPAKPCLTLRPLRPISLQSRYRKL
jgi:hypothetical protein